MADTKVSALPAAASFLVADEIPVNEAGTSKKVTGTQVRTALGLLYNYSTAAQTPAATTRTYLTGSNLAVPASKLAIGSTFSWKFNLTKTAAGSASSTIDVAVGTAGTTADTARVSFSKVAGTAAVDEGFCTVDVICRGPLSASGIFIGEFCMTHSGNTAGHMTIPCQTTTGISGAFDVTTANLIVGLCITTGASDAITIQQVSARAWGL